MSWPALAFPGLPWPSLAFLAPVLAPGHQRRKIVSVLNPPIIPPRQDRPRQKGQGRRQDGRDAAPATLIRAKARTAVLARPAQLGEAFQRAKTASASASVFTGTASVSASACAGTASVSASAFAGTASVSASAFAGTASLGPPRNFRRGVVQAPGARPSAPGAWRQAERARHLAPGRARQARPRASAAPCVPATRITRHVPAPRAFRASRVRRHAQARAGTRTRACTRAHAGAHARARARGREGARAHRSQKSTPYRRKVPSSGIRWTFETAQTVPPYGGRVPQAGIRWTFEIPKRDFRPDLSGKRPGLSELPLSRSA